MLRLGLTRLLRRPPSPPDGDAPRRGEEILPAILAATLEPLILTASDGRVLCVNAPAARLLGYATPLDMADEDLGACLPFEELRAGASAAGEPGASAGPLVVRRRDGGVVTVSVTATRVPGQRLAVSLREAAAPHDGAPAAAGAPAASPPADPAADARLRLARQSFGLGTWEVDIRRSAFWHDAEAASITGSRLAVAAWLPLDAALLAAWRARLHPDSGDAAERGISALLAGTSETVGLACRLSHEDGSWRLVSFQGAAVPPQRPQRLAGIVADLTETVARQAALAADEAGFLFGFEAARVGKAQINPATGRILRANPALARMLGWDNPAALAGRPFLDLLHADCRADEAADWALLLAGGADGYRREVRCLRRGDGPGWARVSATLLPERAGTLPLCLAVVEDIDAQRRAETAFRENEARLKHAIEAAGAGLWEIDLERAVLRADRNAPAFTDGLLPADVEIRLDGPEMAAFIERIHPDDRPGRLARLHALARGASAAETVEYRLRRQDGTWAHLSHRMAVVTRDEASGQPARLVSVVADLTARSQAEARLRESELRFRRLADALPQKVFIQTQAGIATYCNRSYLDYAGPVLTTLADRLAKIHPDDRQAMLDLMTGRFGEADRHEIVLRLRRHDGAHRWHKLEFTRLDGRDQAGLWLCAATDIDEAHRSEQALRSSTDRLQRQVDERTADLTASEVRFRAIFEAQFQLMGLLSPDGTVLEANQPALAFAGRSAEEAIGLPFWDAGWWGADHDLEGQLRDVVARAAGGEFVRYEAELTGVDGRTVLLDISLKPFRDVATGEVTLLITEARDITERRDLERRLARAQKLEAVGQLTSGIAHDFNNLLTVVLMNTDVLRQAVAPDNAPILRKLEMIEQAATRGGRLASQLLAFSRKQTLRPETVMAGRLINGIGRLLQRALGETVQLDLRDRETWPCRVDPAQLESAVLNLVINARDAMPPEGGTVVVETRDTSIAGEAAERLNVMPGAYVQIDVSDTGHGMPPEILERVFEPFFTTKEVGKGSGLGLAQVHGFVGQSGGAVAIESEPGRGTTVSLFLPRGPDAAPALAPGRDPAPSSPAPQGGGRTVLAVEDEPVLRESLRNVLAEAGYQVLAESDARGAERILASGQPVDALLSDIVLPGGVNGIELAHRARGLRPGIRILLTSGYAEDALARHGTDGDDFDILPKPYPPDDLLARLAALLGDAPGEG